jgi:hypothetical protein
MTRDKIFKLAREAGAHDNEWEVRFVEPRYLVRFFRAAYEAGASAEREACARVCEARYMGDNNREDMEARRCAEAIRARGKP